MEVVGGEVLERGEAVEAEVAGGTTLPLRPPPDLGLCQGRVEVEPVLGKAAPAHVTTAVVADATEALGGEAGLSVKAKPVLGEVCERAFVTVVTGMLGDVLFPRHNFHSVSYDIVTPQPLPSLCQGLARLPTLLRPGTVITCYKHPD